MNWKFVEMVMKCQGQFGSFRYLLIGSCHDILGEGDIVEDFHFLPAGFETLNSFGHN